MNTAVAELGSRAKALKLDLRGKTPDEVVTILQEHGYSNVRHRPEKGWGLRSIFNFNPSPEDKKQIVRCVPIKDSEAPNLTVVVHDGREHTLQPGHDLHFFEPIGDKKGGWGWARTSLLYK